MRRSEKEKIREMPVERGRKRVQNSEGTSGVGERKRCRAGTQDPGPEGTHTKVKNLKRVGKKNNG